MTINIFIIISLPFSSWISLPPGNVPGIGLDQVVSICISTAVLMLSEESHCQLGTDELALISSLGSLSRFMSVFTGRNLPPPPPLTPPLPPSQLPPSPLSSPHLLLPLFSPPSPQQASAPTQLSL